MDPISDMLTRMRNALRSRKEVIEVPANGVKKEIARILKEEGYISNFKIFDDGKSGMLKILLRYSKDKEPAIAGIERVSRPSRRVYRSFRDLSSPVRGFATSVVSTPKGVLTGRQAENLKVGGEVILRVW
ncbi:MAG: 30S ribosomal protein S8 [Elusimicrobia bacterium]|nr:30S ribosomal protein S8 [Elusimicrobiota bacterium]